MKLDNDVTKHTNTHYMHFASMCSVDSELDISIAILVSHPTLSCSTSEHALTGICLSAAKKKTWQLASFHPIHRIVSNRYAMPPPPSPLPTYRSKLVFLYSLPDRVGGQLDSSVSSGRRVHQRHHPRDRRGVVEGQ